ncbi:MAG TPA: hypothetical protein VLR27_11940 [Acidimicrobiales bacterium]|nr:hypothetical protein [Acidimicrobiales bacterium]
MLPRQFVIAVALAASATALAGCGDDEVASDAERFCGEATVNRDMIVAPPLSNEAEVAATLDFYRLMGQLAPIAIAEEWNELVVAMETAAAIVPGDPASEQEVAMTAYATERSAYEIAVWLQRNCGVAIPITTIAPQAPLPPPTTALVPPPSTVATVTE